MVVSLLWHPGRNSVVHDKVLCALSLVTANFFCPVPLYKLLVVVVVFFPKDYSPRWVVIIIYHQCSGPRKRHKEQGVHYFSFWRCCLSVLRLGWGEIWANSKCQLTFGPFVWSLKVLMLSENVAEVIGNQFLFNFGKRCGTSGRVRCQRMCSQLW